MFKKKKEEKEIDKTVFKKIDNYLARKGHRKVMSIYLEEYNKSNIYICLSFIKNISVYKIAWFDLNFINVNHLDDYINIQLVNKDIAFNILKSIASIKYPEEIRQNDDIIGDRVYINIKREKKEITYGFTRFLPLDWEKLIDPIVLTFSYLPRNLDIYLNEFFAIYDGTDEIFTYTKPIKFDLLNSNPAEHFDSFSIEVGTRFYKNNHVLFLEEVDDKFYCIVEDKEPHLVILNQVDETHSMMWCNCKSGHLCPHIFAALLALRKNNFNRFYKVKYNGKDETLLEKVMYGNFYLCYGINNDKILLVTLTGDTFAADIMYKGKCMFEVIEDDDECHLSQLLKDYNQK